MVSDIYIYEGSAKLISSLSIGHRNPPAQEPLQYGSLAACCLGTYYPARILRTDTVLAVSY